MLALRSEDELFHISLYSWLISDEVDMVDRLVEVRVGFISKSIHVSVLVLYFTCCLYAFLLCLFLCSSLFHYPSLPLPFKLFSLQSLIQLSVVYVTLVIVLSYTRSPFFLLLTD